MTIPDQVLKLIWGEIKEFKDPRTIALCQIDKTMVEQGWVREEFESNGWQYDWWMVFTKDDKKIRFAGSAFYGGVSGEYESGYVGVENAEPH